MRAFSIFAVALSVPVALVHYLLPEVPWWGLMLGAATVGYLLSKAVYIEP